MKLLLLLACSLSWPQFQAVALDPPEDDNFQCLENDIFSMDILRRHQVSLIIHPQVRVGCETVTIKPFLKGPFDFRDTCTTRACPISLLGERYEYERKRNIVEQVENYYVIDASGVKQQVEPGSSVTFATAISNSSGEPQQQTFTFDQICFPRPCFRDEKEYKSACATEFKDIDETEGVRNWPKDRNGYEQYSPSLPNIHKTWTYCRGNASTESVPLIGPLRTPERPLGQTLTMRKKRTKIYTDHLIKSMSRPFGYSLRKDDWKSDSPFPDVAAIFYSYGGHVEIGPKEYFLTCILTVPLQPPFNSSYGANFFIIKGDYDNRLEIEQGQQVDLNDLEYRSWSISPFGLPIQEPAGPSVIVKFEDLCFPAECYGAPPESAPKCDGKYGPVKSDVHASVLKYVYRVAPDLAGVIWPLNLLGLMMRY